MSRFFNLKKAYWEQNAVEKIPTKGLVFHASLNGRTPDVAETGQSIVTHGTASYGDVDGIPCLRHTSSKLSWFSSDGSYPSPNDGAYTLSAWIRHSSSTIQDTPWLFGPTRGSSWGNCMQLATGKSNTFYLLHGGGSGDVSFGSNFSLLKWRCLSIVIDFANNSVKGYADGVLLRTQTSSASAFKKSYTQIRLCTDYSENRAALGTYSMAACRLYNRVLSDSEIQALANEFKPTT